MIRQYEVEGSKYLNIKLLLWERIASLNLMALKYCTRWKMFHFIVWAGLLALFLQPSITAGARAKRKGEFLAGTFILTQKSLSEAPYRYAGVLRKALDRAEMKDPPSKSDEENCDVRYRIRPSGTTEH